MKSEGKLQNFELRTLITFEQIQERSRKMGEEITRAYEGRELMVVIVLRGAMLFAGQLLPCIRNDSLVFDTMQVSTYRGGTASCGMLTVVRDLIKLPENRDILIVEDIVDSALTMQNLIASMLARRAKSVRFATMLNKRAGRKAMTKHFQPDFVGFEVKGNPFLVGFGLDLDEKLRNLPNVCEVIFH